MNKLKNIYIIFLLSIPILNAQRIGINLPAGSTPNTFLDVNGSVAYRGGSAITLSNGVNSDISLSDYSLFRITGPTAAFSITGFNSGVNGRLLTIVNATSQVMTITHQATSSSNNQIQTNGSDITVASNGVVFFIYNTASNKWVLSGGQGFTNIAWNLTGNSGTTAGTNFIGTTDAQDMVIKANDTEGVRIKASNGYIGLNVNNPSSRLSVSNNATIASVPSDIIAHFTNSDATDTEVHIDTYGNSATDDPAVVFRRAAGTAASPLTIRTGDAMGRISWWGHNGLNFVDQSSKIDVSASENWTTTANGTQMEFYTTKNGTNFFNRGMTLSNDGFLGIGTRTPPAPLSILNNGGGSGIADDVFITSFGASVNPGYITFSARGSVAAPANLQNDDQMGNISFYGRSGGGAANALSMMRAKYRGDGITPLSNLIFATSNTERMVLDENGNLGIGLTNPSSKLHIATGTDYDGITLKSSTATTGTYLKIDAIANAIANTPPQSMWIDNKENADIALATNSLVRLWVKANGNVGIGCNAPNYPLQVTGDIAASGILRASSAVVSTAFTACSDSRFKQNITPLSNALENVIKLQGVTYDWRKKEFPDRYFNDKKQIGIIAQDLEKIYPELVDTDEKGYKSVDYSKITPILIEAIKAQNETLNNQQKEIEALKNQMKQFTNQLEAVLKKQN
jgi:hypothetical protein